MDKVFFVLFCFIAIPVSYMAKANEFEGDKRINVEVGVFVTAIYDVDIPAKKFTVKAWIWSTYDPHHLPEDYQFNRKIELTNARHWHITESENFILNNADGTVHSMTKFTAEINQDWNIKYFPFDKQDMMIEIESIELDSNVIQYVPDTLNSRVSETLTMSGWRISPLQMRSFDYKYSTTFGQQSGSKGVYPRLSVVIPIERYGTRIFWTYFLGFFVSYVIISILPFFNKTMIESRIGLITSALFACVGNKYTIDLLLPSNNVFTLSDLIQVATFAIVGIGLLNSVMIVLLSTRNKQALAYKIDALINIGIMLGYPAVIGYAVFIASSV